MASISEIRQALKDNQATERICWDGFAGSITCYNRPLPLENDADLNEPADERPGREPMRAARRLEGRANTRQSRRLRNPGRFAPKAAEAWFNA